MAISCSKSTHTVVLSNSRTELHGQIHRIWVADISAEIIISIWRFCSLSNRIRSWVFYLFYPQKENKYTEIATTTKKQNKFKVFCFFHSLPEIYQSWSIILVLFQEQAMINKPACMKSVTLKIWKKKWINYSVACRTVLSLAAANTTLQMKMQNP